MDALTCINIKKPVITVKHADLERTDTSSYRSVCPKCKAGTLLVSRNQKTFKLLAEDRCVLCGQLFIYSDIAELQKRSG